MKYILIFGALALALLFNLTQVQAWYLRVPLLSGALCFAGVAMAYGGVGPKIFLKESDGRLPWLSWLIFWPYHSLNFLTLRMCWKKATKSGDLFSKIEGNVWLGARLSERDAQNWAQSGISVLDLAGELSENAVFRQAEHYLSLPTLDRYAPSLEELRYGAEWIERQQHKGPVYIHCALGHGRSATFVAAYLLRNGRAATVSQALEMMARQRPSIDLSLSQIQLLKQLQ